MWYSPGSHVNASLAAINYGQSVSLHLPACQSHLTPAASASSLHCFFFVVEHDLLWPGVHWIQQPSLSSSSFERQAANFSPATDISLLVAPIFWQRPWFF